MLSDTRLRNSPLPSGSAACPTLSCSCTYLAFSGVRGSGELISELEPACSSSDGRRRRTGLLYEVASNGHEVVVRLLIEKWTTLNQFSATALEGILCRV